MFFLFIYRVDVVLPFASASEDSITQAMAKLSYKGSYTATAEALETAIGIFRSGGNSVQFIRSEVKFGKLVAMRYIEIYEAQMIKYQTVFNKVLSGLIMG